MDIIQDFLQYEDKHGLIQPRVGHGSFNGLLYTGIAVVLLKRHGYADVALKYIYAMMKCQTSEHAGLYHRTPEGAGGQEGPDDYIGICAASQELALYVCRYGRRTWWTFNNITQGKFTLKSWLGRQPQLVAHMMYGAGLRPGIFRRFWWAVVIAYSAFAKKENQDAWMLAWLLITTFEKVESPSRLGRLAVRYWDWKMRRNFGPEGLKNLVYLEGNTDHAINRWWLR